MQLMVYLNVTVYTTRYRPQRHGPQLTLRYLGAFSLPIGEPIVPTSDNAEPAHLAPHTDSIQHQHTRLLPQARHPALPVGCVTPFTDYPIW